MAAHIVRSQRDGPWRAGQGGSTKGRGCGGGPKGGCVQANTSRPLRQGASLIRGAKKRRCCGRGAAGRAGRQSRWGAPWGLPSPSQLPPAGREACRRQAAGPGAQGAARGAARLGRRLRRQGGAAELAGLDFLAHFASLACRRALAGQGLKLCSGGRGGQRGGAWRSPGPPWQQAGGVCTACAACGTAALAAPPPPSGEGGRADAPLHCALRVPDLVEEAARTHCLPVGLQTPEGRAIGGGTSSACLEAPQHTGAAHSHPANQHTEASTPGARIRTT